MNTLLPIVAIGMVFNFAFILDAQEARLCVTSQEVKALCGTSNVLLVFINNNSLYYVDFSSPDPVISTIAAVHDGIAPVISPDGKSVVYSVTGGPKEYFISNGAAWFCELSSGAKPFKVADPAFVPRFVYGAATTTVLYSTCGKRSDRGHIWDGCGKVVRREVGTGAIGPEMTVWEHGSYFGGISVDNRYVSTAEESENAFILDLQSQSGKPDTLHKFSVKKLSTGIDTTVSIQVCNISSSPSSRYPNTALYIDFSSGPFAASGCSPPPDLGEWETHSRMFITRSDGKILRFFDIPKKGFIVPSVNAHGTGEPIVKQWNYPEWSNHPYFAVASIYVDRLWLTSSWEDTYRDEAVYLINLKDSTYHKILEAADTSRLATTNLQWPWLWIEVPSTFVEDSSWLGQRSGVDFSMNPHDAAEHRVRLQGATITSFGCIEAIRVYTLTGRLSACFTFGNPPVHSVTADRTFKIAPGLYCLQVVSRRGNKRYTDNVRFAHL